MLAPWRHFRGRNGVRDVVSVEFDAHAPRVGARPEKDRLASDEGLGEVRSRSSPPSTGYLHGGRPAPRRDRWRPCRPRRTPKRRRGDEPLCFSLRRRGHRCGDDGADAARRGRSLCRSIPLLPRSGRSSSRPPHHPSTSIWAPERAKSGHELGITRRDAPGVAYPAGPAGDQREHGGGHRDPVIAFAVHVSALERAVAAFHVETVRVLGAGHPGRHAEHRPSSRCDPLSLCRSSSAFRMRVVPRALAARAHAMGISSIARGMVSPPMEMALNRCAPRMKLGDRFAASARRAPPPPVPRPCRGRSPGFPCAWGSSPLRAP